METSRFYRSTNLNPQSLGFRSPTKLVVVGFLLMVSLLSACAGATQAPEAAAVIETVEVAAPAEAPAAAQIAAPPAYPVLAGTPIPSSSARIQARSAAQIELLAVWGSAAFDRALYSPDGRWIAAASSPGVRLYQAGSLKPDSYLASADTVRSMAFTPDSALLITGTEGGRLRVWNMAQRAPVLETPIQAGAISSLAVAADGNLLAASTGMALLLYDLRLQAVVDLQTSPSVPTSLAFSPVGDFLAVGGSTGSVDIWSTRAADANTTGLTLLSQADPLPGGITQVAFSPSPNQGMPILGATAQDGSVQTWQLAADGRSLQALEGWREQNDSARSLAFSPDGNEIAYGYQNGAVYLRDIFSPGQPAVTLVAEQPPFSSLAYSPNGNDLVTSTMTLQLWDTRTASLRGGLDEVHHQALCLVYSPDGSILAAGTQQGGIELYNAQTGVLNLTLSSSGSPVTGLAGSPDGRWLASGDQAGVVQLWSLPDGAPLLTIAAHGGALTDLEFSPDGTLLATAGLDNQVRLWNPADGSPLAILPGDPQPGSWVSGLAFAPDGATLAAGGSSGLVRIWRVNPLPDPTLAAPAAEFPTGGALSGLAFLPSFAASFPTLVTLNEGGQLGLWNIQDGSLQSAFQAVPSAANGLAIAPGGDVAAIAYQAGLALVELGTYTTSYPGSEQAASALAAAFSPDGLLLAAAMQAGTIQIWGIP